MWSALMHRCSQLGGRRIETSVQKCPFARENFSGQDPDAWSAVTLHLCIWLWHLVNGREFLYPKIAYAAEIIQL